MTLAYEQCDETDDPAGLLCFLDLFCHLSSQCTAARRTLRSAEWVTVDPEQGAARCIYEIAGHVRHASFRRRSCGAKGLACGDSIQRPARTDCYCREDC